MTLHNHKIGLYNTDNPLTINFNDTDNIQNKPDKLKLTSMFFMNEYPGIIFMKVISNLTGNNTYNNNKNAILSVIPNTAGLNNYTYYMDYDEKGSGIHYQNEIKNLTLTITDQNNNLVTFTQKYYIELCLSHD